MTVVLENQAICAHYYKKMPVTYTKYAPGIFHFVMNTSHLIFCALV